MATSESFIGFVLDQLASIPSARARKMFGEYALYCDDKVVALVCDDQLFMKVTAGGRALIGARYEEGIAYPGAKPSMLLDARDIEDADRLCALVKATAAELPPPKPKRPRKQR